MHTEGRIWMQFPTLSDTLRVSKGREVVIETTATEHLEEAEIEVDAHAFQLQQEQQRIREKSQAQAREYKVGVIVVDHGSRRAEANNALAGVVNDFQALSGYELVEPAHMELAEPSIATAFGRCVERGATFIICHPFFLSRGRHVAEDIPTLLEEAASIFPGVEWALSQPLGSQAEIPRLMQMAVEDCVVEQNIKSEDHADGSPLPEFNI
ncbi:sirohydrochlorin ferrochelatase-like [Nannochloropsis oceanica]